MGAIESTMTNGDNNGHPMNILLADTYRDRSQKNDRTRRDSIQTFYSANEELESNDHASHSPGIDNETAWSPLKQDQMKGRLAEPFQTPERKRPNAKPRVSDRLDEPFSFSVPEIQRSHVKPRVSDRLDNPFSGPDQLPFDRPLTYDDKHTSHTRKAKQRPESSISLNSQISREIKNFHGHEPAASHWQTPIDPRAGDVPLPLDTAGKSHNRPSRLTKNKRPEQDINPPSRRPVQQRELLPHTRAVEHPRPLPKVQGSRKYLSKRPPPLSLKGSSRDFEGSGSCQVGPDISILSGETAYVQPRRLLVKKPKGRGDVPKDFSKSKDYEQPSLRPGKQQQLHTQHSPVSPISSGPLGSPVSSVSSLSFTDNHRDLSQKEDRSDIISPELDKPDSEVEILQPTKLQPQRVFPSTPSRYLESHRSSDEESSGEEADSTLWRPVGSRTGLFAGRFEFELDIPVVTETYEEPASESESDSDSQADVSAKGKCKQPVRVQTKTIDATTIEGCVEITEFEIIAVDKGNQDIAVDEKNQHHYLECIIPSKCFIMNNKPSEKKNDDVYSYNNPATRKARYYGIIEGIRFPRHMKQCTLVANFNVQYSPKINFSIKVKDWKVDVEWIRREREQ
ncbi:uncharacterized protein TRUGW13939_01765 [Talaromyces rugulosus]|uniref:Uncharacterized protein n=1 Tax=Talaromyces rugulosus TaxID=121627 RepID=A0A7H8QL82_TALRU|nr:uncharacterized protein TRUGW13939_01765 [Talaromyces rugulosus]QKX54677.1 hypothetical protein TRUGW13939_01765 [Talaromyces rugulosus]